MGGNPFISRQLNALPRCLRHTSGKEIIRQLFRFVRAHIVISSSNHKEARAENRLIFKNLVRKEKPELTWTTRLGIQRIQGDALRCLKAPPFIDGPSNLLLTPSKTRSPGGNCEAREIRSRGKISRTRTKHARCETNETQDLTSGNSDTTSIFPSMHQWKKSIFRISLLHFLHRSHQRIFGTKSAMKI